jgi:hypothetical protein
MSPHSSADSHGKKGYFTPFDQESLQTSPGGDDFALHKKHLRPSANPRR